MLVCYTVMDSMQTLTWELLTVQIGHTAPDLQGTTAAADAGTAAATPASAVTTAVATAACMNATVLSDSTPPQEAKPSANNEQAWVGGSSLIGKGSTYGLGRPLCRLGRPLC